MSMKTGILGGTFDPIHKGHMQLAATALRQFGLDRVLLIPTGKSYHKRNSGVQSTDHRLAMTRLAALEDERYEVSDVDIRREGNTYTVDTLRDLLEEEPEQELYYIVGEDSLDYMDRWYHADEIFRMAVILAAPREDAESEHADTSAMEAKIAELERDFDADVRILDCPVLPISSTQIRAMAGDSYEEGSEAETAAKLSELIPEAVCAYIYQNHLYQRSESAENE